MELPMGWTTARLDELCDSTAPIIYGILQPGPEQRSGVPYVRPTEIVDGEIDLSQVRRTTTEIATKYRRAALKPGDILLSIVGTIGKVAIVPKALDGANITQSSVRIRPGSRLDGGFLRACLRSPQLRTLFEERRIGTGVPRLNVADVRELEIPLPPLPEQRRIVAKLDSLQARSRRAKEALDAIPPLLERLRQSVLAAAFRGDLTAEWRAKNPEVEPATELLKRIRVERRRKWEEAELAKMAAKGKRPGDDRWKARYVEPAAVDASGLPELPSGWCWARAEEVCGFITKGATPSADEIRAGEGDVPFIKVYNLRDDGTLDFSTNPTFISRLVHDGELARSRVLPGDVLMNIVGPPLGKVSVVPPAHPEWNINQAIAIFRPCNGLNRSFLCHALLDRETVGWSIRRAKATSGQLNLTLELCRDLPLPLAPEREQTEAVSRIEAYLRRVADCDATEGALKHSLVGLNRAILAKAFRGELVPQDPREALEVEAPHPVVPLRSGEGQVVASRRGKARGRGR
jgi:type I restriction enzyme S subunit